jgi:MSHA pilin protein MshA
MPKMILTSCGQAAEEIDMKSKAQAGFTLVELIVVIVILGILAAVAVPRFLGLESQARAASIRSLGGTINSAVSMAHGICVAQNCVTNQVITMDGKPITFRFGYPNNASAKDLLQTTEGFTVSAGGNRFTKTGAKTTNCWVQYAQAANATTPPVVTYHNTAIIDAATETSVTTDLFAQC